jgi:homoserine kinase type II
MAVFTQATDQQIAKHLELYSLDALVKSTAIAEGTDNSNYILQTQNKRYIFTIFEQRFEQQNVSFYIDLMKHFANHGILCPAPIATKSGAYIADFDGKPSVIVTFMEGKSIKHPDTTHLKEIGTHLAKLHLAGSDFEQKRENDFNPVACRNMFNTLGEKAESIKTGLAAEIEQELSWIESHWPDGLPSGIIHADLFPDNVFFSGQNLSALIDFYYACYDAYLYDVAICLNAWCFERGNDFNITKAKALLSAYNHIRPLSQKEKETLPVLASAAAMRFLLMRLQNWKRHAEDTLVTHRDPVEYLHRIRFHHGMSQSELYGI